MDGRLHCCCALVRVAMLFAATDRYSAASAQLGRSLIHSLTPSGATSFLQVRRATRCRSRASITALQAAARSCSLCSDRVWVLFFFPVTNKAVERVRQWGAHHGHRARQTPPLLPTTLVRLTLTTINPPPRTILSTLYFSSSLLYCSTARGGAA